MLRTLDRYLLRQFLTTMMVVAVATTMTFVVINMVDELRDFIDHEIPILSILEYYLYFAGWALKSFLPMFVLLATLFSVSILARRNELLALKSSGVSLYRIALPLVLLAAVLSVGHFYYNEYLFPPANKKRLEMKEFTIERRSREYFSRVRNIYRQIRPGHFYTISNFNIARQEGQDFKLYKTAANRLEQIITAQLIVYDYPHWKAVNGSTRMFSASGQESYVTFDTLVVADIAEKPEDLAKRMGKPEDMGLDELQEYIDLMKRTGGPYLRESIDLKLKYSYPLASVIIMFICIPFASNSRRGGIAVSIAFGAMVALAYFVLFRISQSAGYNGKIPEEVAVWGVNGLFLLIGLVLMIKARK